MSDDDLFAAFASDDDPFSGVDDDDPFASLGSFDDDPFESLGAPEADAPEAEPEDVPEDHTSPTMVSSPTVTPSSSARPEWLSELSGFDDEFGDQPARTSTPAVSRETRSSSVLSGMVGSGSQGVGFGMTAQQRMILSIFLFLDTAVIGVMILMYIGAINVF